MEPEARRVAPGRLPERVYWFRRAIVLVGLALVISLLMWLVSLAGAPKAAAPGAAKAAAPATTRTPSPPDSLQATALPAPATTAPSTSATATDQPTTTASPAECDPGVLDLTLAGPGAVKAGATAQLTATVTNTGQDTCTFTFDSRFTLRIVSGTDEIWSTANCGQWAPTGSHTLAPGAAATWQTTWDRHRSEATCKVVVATLKPGTYVANALYPGAATAQLVMLLTA